jgi:hypothetical protein
MAGNIKKRRAITGVPELIYTDDVSVQAYLRGLAAPSFLSDTANAEWSLAATDTEAANLGLTGGSAYLISPTAARKVHARNYSGG